MLMTTALATLLVLQCSELCVAIKVPVVWNGDNSEVKQNGFNDEEFSVEIFKPPTIKQEPVPIEYFHYPAKKPQFAVDIAQFHGVPSPASHYKAYPIRPQTGYGNPDLGKHRLQDENRQKFAPLQRYLQNKENYVSQVIPVVSNYEVYHPYKAEEPALQEIYKDPVWDKIRNDLRDTSKRLQNYEKEAGKAEIEKEEYLETPEETDRKKVPHPNVPVRYEVHEPQRRPVYYNPLPKFHNHDQVLNQRFRHPWNQNDIKIRPASYQPLKNHLGKLRQHHALTYDDERNEYPQVPAAEEIEQPPDGYDIYEKGKNKYIKLRNNVDESINQAVRENNPVVTQNLELQPNEQPEVDEEDEFVPVKSYAQVRKTETMKHLPREAAFEDADTYEEIRNAPRLKEAVKTSKAQTVYSEEGYEDSAYDHAGEQKHASDHEGHGGYLKQNEISGGKYKAPSISAKYDDNRGSAYRDQLLHGKKWSNSDEDTNAENDAENYSEDEHEQSVNADTYRQNDDDNQRNKRENVPKKSENESLNVEVDNEHDLNKREVNFEVPEINLNSTFLTEGEILEIAKEKLISQDDLKTKYPYYFKNLTSINKDSPLKYAENFKFIPKKSEGGTEFYDSRSKLECPEVDDKVDAIPKKLKKKGHPDSPDENESNEKGEEGDPIEEQPRLKGLGDKIDCFKAKYFGENPLDSPFFKEDIIANPEPVTLPNLSTFKLAPTKKISSQESREDMEIDGFEKLRIATQNDVFELVDKLRNGPNKLKESLVNGNSKLITTLETPENISHRNKSHLLQQANVYSDLLDNIKGNSHKPLLKETLSNISQNIINETNTENNKNTTYDHFFNKEDITQLPPIVRKKRASPFVYEPYKIIKDGQVQESKKTTTTSNISPLIKQLQSSRVVDKVTKSDKDKEQVTKNSKNTRTYKDIGKKDRAQSKGTKEDSETELRFVDVSVDSRRGEPKYELRHPNHKPEYSSVENKKTMSIQEYQAQTKHDLNNDDTKTTKKNNPVDVQHVAASNTVHRSVATTTSSPTKKSKSTPKQHELNENDDEYYDEYEDEEDEEEIRSTTTTTTPKPIFRKKIRTTTTTEKPEEDIETETEVPKLRLVTRFNAPTTEKHKIKSKSENKRKVHKNEDDDEIHVPKYTEKKKKSTKSTLVTDTERYGDDESDDMTKEVDALIGVKHSMEDYMPNYEKEELKRRKENTSPEFSNESDDDDIDDYDGDDENDDDDIDEDEIDKDDEDDEENRPTPPVTTPEPTKRTLIRTTDAPLSTTEAITAKDELKPIVLKKKIEIHKELPVNKSAPHVTQFKEDIKEVEIIKEIPRKPTKSPQKNIELLELYKDENLPKDVNKLKDVEVFKENLDLVNGPKHGGNYRSAKLIELAEEASTIVPMHGGNLKAEPKEEIDEYEDDAQASQSENKKSIELDSNYTPGGRMHGGNLKSINDFRGSRRPTGRNAKFIELVGTTELIPRARHGGNLKSVQDASRRRGNKKSDRLTELNEHDKEDDGGSSGRSYGGSSKSYGGGRQGGRAMHGGNYRSAKLVQTAKTTVKPQIETPKPRGRTSKEAKNKAAVLLNSFAQAVPILTTTPAYILDPSKRMYYYVDA